MIGLTPGPIGRPIKYQITVNKIHDSDINKKYGDISVNAPLIV